MTIQVVESWTSTHERDFLRELGTPANSSRISRMELLIKYRDALENRVNFEPSLGKGVIKALVNAEIQRDLENGRSDFKPVLNRDGQVLPHLSESAV